MSDTIVLIGYGSLMSGCGLGRGEPLGLRALAPVELRNARRGFGKLSQHGDCYAMVLEPVDASRPIVGRIGLSGSKLGSVRTEAGIGAVAFAIAIDDLGPTCRREGYDFAAIQRLRARADRERLSFGELLWRCLETVDLDFGAYRRSLFDMTGHASPHYVPHPIPLEDGRVAVTFLPPGEEGSGDPEVVPVRVATGETALLDTVQAWRRKANATQLTYFGTCLLAGLHEVDVTDLLPPLEERELRRALVEHLRPLAAAEGPLFRSLTGLDDRSHAATFARPQRRPFGVLSSWLAAAEEE